MPPCRRRASPANFGAMRDTTALLQRLSLLACIPLLAPGCDDSAPKPTSAQQPKVAKRTSPGAAKAADDAKAPASAKTPVGPRVNKAPPPPPLPTDPDELRMMPIDGDPPFIDGYNPEEETCPSGNWCGAAEAALHLIALRRQFAKTAPAKRAPEGEILLAKGGETV